MAKDRSEDVNSQVGFESALATAVGRDLTDEERSQIREDDTDVRAGIVYDSGDQSTESADDEPVAQDDEESPPEPELEGEAKQLADAQAMIGRQSGEIGELRRQLQEQAVRTARLEGEMSAYEDVPNQADPSVYQRVSQIAEEQGGQQAVMAATQTGDRELIDHAVDLWIEEGDDPGAIKYLAKWEAWKAANPPEGQQRQSQEATGGLSEEDRATLLDQRQRNVLDNLRTEMGVEKFNAVAPHVETVLSGLPETIRNSFAEQMAGSEAQIKEAFTAVLKLAEPLATTKATRVVDEQRKGEKKAARVTTGSAQVSGGQSGSKVSAESSSEEIQDWLRSEILKAPSTSVQDNIEWAK